MTANKDKDFWDRLDVISGLVGTAATIAIAITGAILTWRYNVKQSEYNTISIKTSSIEHLDRQSGEQRETAYNILIRLDPEEFIALSRDYPTRLKIKQLVKYAEDEDKEFSDLAIKALEDIITKYEKESYNLLDNTKKTETIDIIDYIAKGNYKNNKKDNALFKIVEFFNKQQNNNNKQQNNN
ncbi:MAG TPA: hypothetical protein DCF68_22290, partial [Cyanothece sp. UBA12306]|nr:hypothetical protein [Cyanothece sp. UBA12306]